MTKLAGSLRSGGTTWLTQRWRAADALEQTAHLRLTTVAGIPTQVALMLRNLLVDRFRLTVHIERQERDILKRLHRATRHRAHAYQPRLGCGPVCGDRVAEVKKRLCGKQQHQDRNSGGV